MRSPRNNWGTTNERGVTRQVVRYGLNLACFPDAHAVELVKKQIAQQRRREDEEGLG
jgi:hypothetical protein